MPLVEAMEGVRQTVTAVGVAASTVSAVARAAENQNPEPVIPEVPEGGLSLLAELNGADIVILMLTLSVVVQVLNIHWFKIPSSVAMAFGSILITVFLLILSHVPFFGAGIGMWVDKFRDFLKDFPDLLLHYMLGFLLFAGAVEVDLRSLERILSTVLALSLVSTLLSMFMVGFLTYLLMQNIAYMDLSWCLLFGAIVSPTDPVTVLSITGFKPELLPISTKYFLVCESLFNDAVGVVLYLTMLQIVQKPDIQAAEIVSLAFQTVVVECVYGLAIGVFLAWLAYSAMGSVKDPLLEVAISFILVGNINMVCRIADASIPLAAVGAGLFIGNYGVNFAMQEETVETFHAMWKLADETLNSVLFLMIGAADLFWKPQDLGWTRVATLVVSIISISLVVRVIAVALPLVTIVFIEWLTKVRLRHESVRYRGGTIGLLTWSGMRGGISIALALGVPDSFVKHAVPGHMTYGQLIFFMTFILVVFSIVVQGMFFETVIHMINRVSYQIMPSGGLGTYVSTLSLGNYSGESGEDVPVDSILGPEQRLWEAGGDFVGNKAVTPPFSNTEKNDDILFSDEGRQAPGEEITVDGLRHTVSMIDQFVPPSALTHEEMRGHDHTRQGSITFQNLQPLEAPPSINAFLGNLGRQGTSSFVKWFDSRGRVRQSNNENGNQLRRSQTEPDNAWLARGEEIQNMIPGNGESSRGRTSTTENIIRNQNDTNQLNGN